MHRREQRRVLGYVFVASTGALEILLQSIASFRLLLSSFMRKRESKRFAFPVPVYS